MVPGLRKDGGHQRVGDGFERAVGGTEGEHAPEQELVGGRVVHPGGRAEGDECGKHVQREGGDDQLAVADLIDKHPADHDAEAETGEARSTDRAELGTGEIKLGGPGGEKPSANAESDAGGENGGETGC